ncbi:MAG TPA: response regulator transcription factor [Streptosporangiaceae bacterium]|nr:response regulator transcription factor [Streptosporangiaceae bacterium]
MTAPPARVTVQVAVQSSRRLLRDTLSACLDVHPDIAVVGKVAEPDAVFELCELRRPDVVILDAGSRLSEISARVTALTRRYPELNVIMTYRDASEQDLAAACRAGVASLVPESKGLAAVLALLRRSRGRHAKDSPGGLTDRELELVVLTGSGHSVAEIAALLGLSPLTVENLKRRVYAKLDVSSSVHAVAKAASLGLLDPSAASTGPLPAVRQRRPPAEADGVVLAVVSGQYCSALDQAVSSLVSSSLPFVLVRQPGPVADTHWARWHRGPIVAVLVDPAPADWDLVAELSVPAILVHSKPLESPELAEVLACGASALVSADRMDDHFLSVLRMVGQGYLVVDSMPMRPLIGAVRARWDERAPGRLELPELTARESDILRSLAEGHSIRQTARALGIAPKTVENVQTRLFRKLGVRNRSGALAVADAFGLLPPGGAQPPGAPPKGFASPEGYSSLSGGDWRP